MLASEDMEERRHRTIGVLAVFNVFVYFCILGPALLDYIISITK